MFAAMTLWVRLYLTVACPETVARWDDPRVTIECRGSVDPLCGLPNADDCELEF